MELLQLSDAASIHRTANIHARCGASHVIHHPAVTVAYEDSAFACRSTAGGKHEANPAPQISVIRRRTLKRLQVSEPSEEEQEICTVSLW